MRCLGCDIVKRSRIHKAISWPEFQLCPRCFCELVPEYYEKNMRSRIMAYGK